MKNKVFVLSTGRAGTTFLSKKIDALKLSDKNLHQDKHSRKLNIFSNATLKYPFLEKRLIRKMEANPEILTTQLDPLKSMTYFFYLKDLKENQPEKFEKYTIVHLVRDPRDFVRSFLNWKNRKLSGKIAHHVIPFWMPKPKGKSFYYNSLMSKFEHYCWTWKIKNELFSDTFAHCPNYKLIRFEDMVSNETVLSDLIQKIVGKKADLSKLESKEKINQSKVKTFPHWTKWSKKQTILLDKICGKYMNELGYGNEEQWLEKMHNEK